MARAPFSLYPAWLAVFVMLNPPAAIAQEQPTNLAGRTDNHRADVKARPGPAWTNVTVVLTDRSATISGRVPIDLHRREGGGTLVVVFPDDESLWESRRLITHDTPDADGGFRVEGIAPGMVYRVGVQAWSDGLSNLKDLARTAARVYVDRPGAYHVTLASRR
jgi:hypothetical protein